MSFLLSPSKIRSSTTGGGSTGRRSAEAALRVSTTGRGGHGLYGWYKHLAPEPHALARSGCWMTDISYVKCLPSFVTRLFVLFVSLLTGIMLAIVSEFVVIQLSTPRGWNEPNPARSDIFSSSSLFYRIFLFNKHARGS